MHTTAHFNEIRTLDDSIPAGSQTWCIMVLKYKQDKHILAGFGPHKYTNYSRKRMLFWKRSLQAPWKALLPISQQPHHYQIQDQRFCSHLPVMKFFKRSRAAPDARGPICLPAVGKAPLHATVSVQRNITQQNRSSRSSETRFKKSRWSFSKYNHNVPVSIKVFHLVLSTITVFHNLLWEFEKAAM